MAHEESEAVLALLHNHAATGQPLEAADVVDVILLPLMKHHRPLADVLREGIGLVRTTSTSANDTTLDADLVIGGMLGLAYTVIAIEPNVDHDCE